VVMTTSTGWRSPPAGLCWLTSTDVLVGAQNGLDHPSAISCDNIQTIPKLQLGRLIGYLLPDQEAALAEAITLAFDLEGPL
jgi:mRNA interferase MazF